MHDLIHRHARAHPDALALSAPSGAWTYSALDSAIMATRGRLQEEGIGEGARVGVHMAREAKTVVLLWALWRMGAVAVPLSTRLPTADLGHRARRVGADVLVSPDANITGSSSEDVPVLSPDRVIETEGAEEGASHSLSMERDRPATIVFTSGSTGTPKAALHTWANHVYSAKGSNANIPLRSGDRWLLSLPLYHVGGLAILVRCALVGARVVVPAPEASLAEAVRNSAATHVSLVSTQLRRLLGETDAVPLPSLRAVLLGGGPIPSSLLRRGYDRGWPLHTSYGCTEMASQVTTTAPGAPFDDLRSAGRCLPHRRVRIEDGQILVKGPTLFRGYVTADGQTDPRTEGGWYPTGDRGRIDADGRFFVLGRMDRMFVSGGENVQPEEIEAALERIDGVQRAVVVPVANPEYGQRPVAFVRTTDALRSGVLEDALAETLPRFKIPDAFYSLPDDAAGGDFKIDRERLREQARKLHSTDSLGES